MRITITTDQRQMALIEHQKRMGWDGTFSRYHLLNYARFQTKDLANQFDETSLLGKAAA